MILALIKKEESVQILLDRSHVDLGPSLVLRFFL